MGLGLSVSRLALSASPLASPVPNGTPTPTPTPAPAFTVQPTISPASGTAGTTVFTANPGTVSDGAITSRVWRLNGSSISTGTTAAPQAEGTLTYQETATGPGGSTSSTVRSVSVAAAPVPAPAFTVQPTISPASGTAGATEFTATPGTVSNGAITSRAWLLNGSSISTGTTAAPQSEGTLTYQETATGPGGSTSSTVRSANVAAAPTPTPTTPPADWRMPVSAVATSSGISAQQASLASAQQQASSRGYPSYAVGASATEFVDWTMAAAGTLELSWLGATSGTVTVLKNGVDQGYVPLFPAGSNIVGNGGASGRRQHRLITVTVGDVVRLSVTGGGAGLTIAPLLHLRPASGPFHAYLIVGASRGDQNLGSAAFEAAIRAAHPELDVLVYNIAKSGVQVNELADIVETLAPAYAGAVSTAIVESAIGNNVTAARPYTSAQKAALDTDLNRIAAAIKNVMSAQLAPTSVSFRAYGDVTLPDGQAVGSAPYNDNVVHPWIAAQAPDYYDASIGRARIDEYNAILVARSTLNSGDPTHGAAAAQRAELIRTLIPFVTTRSWSGILSLLEIRVAAAEMAATGAANAGTAQTAFNEALYAVAALPAGATKTAYQGRVDAIVPDVLYKVAGAAVTTAEGTKTQADKNAAITAIGAARTSAAGAGRSDLVALIGAESNPAANTLQARANAIIVSSSAKIVGINFTNTTAAPSFNSVSRTAAGTVGTLVADCLDADGNATGYEFVCLASSGATSTSGSPGAQGAAPGAPFPDLVLVQMALRTSGGVTWGLRKLPAGKKVRAQGISSTTRSPNSVTAWSTPASGAGSVDIAANGNVSTIADFVDLVPIAYDDGGTTRYYVDIRAAVRTSYMDANGIRFIVEDARTTSPGSNRDCTADLDLRRGPPLDISA